VSEETSETVETTESVESTEPTAPPAPDPALLAAQQEAQREREEKIRLEERLAAQEKSKPAEPVRQYTATELRALVDAGSLTEDQADQIRQNQSKAEIEAEVLGKVRAEMDARARSTSIQTQLTAYRTAFPDAWQAGTPERVKLQNAFTHLTSVLGRDANDPAVEVEALFAAFGPPERAKETTRKSRETHAETGTGSETSTSTEEGWPSGIPSRIKQHYREAIKKGLYKGIDDPSLQKELSYVRRTRAA
jgi:hypothetical protein